MGEPTTTKAKPSFPGRLRKIGRTLLNSAAVLFLLQFVFALTGPPQWLTDWLVAAKMGPQTPPRTVVVLGGGGIPSESGLIRTYYAAHYGATLTNATFIVALPADGTPETSSVGRMRDELVIRGIPPEKIRMETRGLNTHQEAINIHQMLGDAALHEPIVIVTSGYHMRRAVLSFRAQGFTNVAALHAHGIDAEADPGPLAWLRYTIWYHWSCEAEIARELVALLSYKLKGWI